MNKIFILIALVVFSNDSFSFSGIKFLDEEQKKSVDYGLNPYYSHLAYNQDFKDLEVLPPEYETELYYYLITNFFKFRSLRFEISANPMPILGTYLRDKRNDFYQKARFGEQNLILSLTEGFPEPTAISLFLGERVYLGSEEAGLTGVGLGGLLISAGNRHIVSNKMYDDNWVEGEIKIKGSSIKPNKTVSYSYRGGVKFHSNEEIRNTSYGAIKRSHKDKTYTGWSPFYNSEIELRGDLALDKFDILRITAIVGKKLPSEDKKRVYSLDVGFTWIGGKGYTGEIANEIGEPGVSFLLRPNIEF